MTAMSKALHVSDLLLWVSPWVTGFALNRSQRACDDGIDMGPLRSRQISGTSTRGAAAELVSVTPNGALPASA